MKEFILNTKELCEYSHKIHAGDKVVLSGKVYTARDAAHKKLEELIKNNKELPFSLNEAVIYYAGPTPTPKGLATGSCGPTTSSRMNSYSPLLFDLGVRCTIGKGPVSQEVCDSIIKNNSIYLCAIGGAGALSASCITKCEVVAFEELGCEAVRLLEFSNFPLICGVDCRGGNIFKK